jgi:hypothetical protein
LLQFGAVDGQSLSSRHCTHRPLSQSGDGAAQFASTTQATQRPRATSQRGVDPLHSASLAQRGFVQTSSSGSQNGSAAPQSALDRH